MTTKSFRNIYSPPPRHPSLAIYYDAAILLNALKQGELREIFKRIY